MGHIIDGKFTPESFRAALVHSDTPEKAIDALIRAQEAEGKAGHAAAPGSGFEAEDAVVAINLWRQLVSYRIDSRFPNG